eukprot:6492537-Amphidinium_carterae.1
MLALGDESAEATLQLSGNSPDSNPEQSGVEKAQLANVDMDEVEIVFAATQSSAGAASSSGGLGAQEQCVHCTRESPIAHMINGGCKGSPRWRCKPCHAAVRYLERAAKSRGEKQYEKFAELRRQKPLHMNDLVLQIRLAPEGEVALEGGEDCPRGMERCNSTALRTERCSKLIESTFSEKGVQDFSDVLWLTERQFRAWMKNHEDMTSAEAQAAWDVAAVSKDTQQRFFKGQKQVQVQGYMGLRGFKNRGTKRELIQEGALSDDDLGDEEKVKRLKPHFDGDLGNFMTQTFADALSTAVSAPALTKGGSGAKSVSDILGDMVKGINGAAAAIDISGDDKPLLEQLEAESLKKMGLVKVRFALWRVAGRGALQHKGKQE